MRLHILLFIFHDHFLWGVGLVDETSRYIYSFLFISSCLFVFSIGNILLTSFCTSWMLDSWVLAHMLGIHSLITHLSSLPNHSSVFIADGPTNLVLGHHEANPTLLFMLSNVLYGYNFLINLLSITTITKDLFLIYFFPYHYTSQDFLTGEHWFGA